MTKYFIILSIASTIIGKAQGKVGINTENPTQNLEVNGTFRVVNLPENNTPNAIYNTDKSSQKDKTFTSSKMVVVDENGVFGQQDIPNTSSSLNQGNNKPFYYLEFVLNNVDGDWIRSYDTKIPHDKYTLVLVGGELFTSNNLFALRVSSGGFTPSTISITKNNNGNWFISADYPNAGPSALRDESTKINANWRIKCLVINNDVVNILNNVTENFNGANNKVATQTPAGLN